MTNSISLDIKEQFMQEKCQYESLSQAIRLAKAYELTDKQIKPLKLLKQQYKKAQASSTNKLLRAMPLSCNILRLEGNWHAIRYTNENGDTLLKMDLIKEGQAYLLMRDGRHQPELLRSELNDLLEPLLCEESLNEYKQMLLANAETLVRDHLGIIIEADEPVTEEPTTEEPTEKLNKLLDEYNKLDTAMTLAIAETLDEFKDIFYEQPVRASSHAVLRWVQRVKGITNEAQAEDIKRRQLSQLTDEVLDAFGMADKVWEDDGISYWFNKDNIMFIVGSADGYPNIVTLYEEDFGFNKDINRMVVLEQLKVLADNKALEVKANEEANEVLATTENNIQTINDQIKALESQMALLVANRAVENAQREQAVKGMRAAKDRYVAEFNKLFRRRD